MNPASGRLPLRWVGLEPARASRGLFVAVLRPYGGTAGWLSKLGRHSRRVACGEC